MRLALLVEHPYLVIKRPKRAHDRSNTMEAGSKSPKQASVAAFKDVPMNTDERALAEKQMYEAMLLADLALAACRRLHSVLRDASKVVNCMFTRTDYMKNGVVHTD
jgi:hypothetical protein